MLLEPAPQGVGVLLPVGFERVEVMNVERQGDAAVAELGEDLDSVLEPVMGEAVGVVAEEHFDCSSHRLDAADLGHMPPQQVFQAHDRRHDRRRAAAANAAEAELSDAVGNVEHFDLRAVEVERRRGMLGKHLGDAGFQVHGLFIILP